METRHAPSSRLAVSASLGASHRDFSVRIDLLGNRVELRRIGADGDLGTFKELLGELDGKADAIGIGGANLGLGFGRHWFPLPEIQDAVARVRHTPVVDGSRLKQVLEYGLGRQLPAREECREVPGRALFASGIDRWHLCLGFIEAGMQYVFADLMFGLGIPIAIRRQETFARLAPWLLPLVSRIPFRHLYPIGADQQRHRPRFARWFDWAGFLVGDCLFLKQYAPPSLTGKVVVTNTTTPEDVAWFANRGVRALITTTPVLQGRSFGTNLMEAALIAASGKGRKLYAREVEGMVQELKWKPTWRSLNGVA